MLSQHENQVSKEDRARSLFLEADPVLLRRFKRFHQDNPEIYELFCRFAREARDTGRKRFSHWMIANRIRWYTTVETTGSEYKLSNDYIALYARLLVYQDPSFDGFFSLKAMKSFRSSVPK